MIRTVSTALVLVLVATIIFDVTANRYLFGHDDEVPSLPKAGEPSQPASVGAKQSETKPNKQEISPLSEIDVFTMKSEGYPRFRIPAVIATTKGTLLAFCEGRTGGDSGDIDLVCKRSTDDGKTWGDLQVVWNDGKNTCGNPAPVVDRDTGKVWLFMTWNLGSDDEKAIMEGTSKDVRHVYVTSSVDDGKTWAVPEKLNDVRQEKWRWYATGPGNGIQLIAGKHQGSLVIPCNHSDHSGLGHPYRSHVVYSDDHGTTWKIGGIEEDRTNESAVVELVGERILHTMRSYHGKNCRAMAVSQDGGESWGKVYLDEALDTPVCQASVLRYSWPADKESDGKSRLLFCSPAGKARDHLTVWISHDEGQSWPLRKEIYQGGSGYSSLVLLPNRNVGVFFEKDGSKSLTFATVSLGWLEGQGVESEPKDR